jgi:hypothetical protein
MKRLVKLVAAVFVLSFAAPSWADTFQFQGQTLNGTGYFSFDKTTTTLTVTGALIDQLAAAFDNNFGPCQSTCNVTGGSLAMDLSGATLSGTTYTFGSNGSLNVNGTVMDSINTIASGSLLSAGFLSGATLQCDSVSCDFSGTLDPGSIGLNPSLNVNGQVPMSGSALQSLKININGGVTSGSVTQASVLVDMVPPPNGGSSPVPEPNSLALIGSGLLGVAGIRSKFLR